VLYVVIVFIAVSVALLVAVVVDFAPTRPGAVSRRLAELERAQHGTSEVLRRRERQARAEQLTGILEMLGERVQFRNRDVSALRLRLVQAGFPQPTAVTVYFGTRLGLPIGLGVGTFLLFSAVGAQWTQILLGALVFTMIGYVAPPFYIGGRIKRRQKEMQKALPDALDLLVVCVEAGLALNQALVRVSEEIFRLSPVLSEQMALTNLEIRAGTPRDEAFRHLGDRTGVADIKSLMAMLIQTDRFGTSVATALRVHSDTLRTKRRQRAEEAAAKTTIKLVFPLVFCIFPAMFVVIIGPALIQIFEALTSLR
jgi:tight adherence protein C